MHGERGPLVALYERMEKGVDPPREDVLSHLKAAISLLGNATAQLNTERRKTVTSSLNEHICPMAKGKFPDRGTYLFRQDFTNKAKTRADSIKALKSVAPKWKQFFPTSGGSAKRPRFINHHAPGHRTNWGQPPYTQSAGSIFSCLGGHSWNSQRQPPSVQTGRPRAQTNPQK